MRFDIYGQFQLDVEPTADGWAVYRVAPGLRIRPKSVVVPEDLEDAEDIAAFFDDLYHEQGKPGQYVEIIG